MGDALIVFAKRWGAIILAYTLVISAVVALVSALESLLGVTIHTPDYYVTQFSAYLSRAADALLTFITDGEAGAGNGFGPLLLYGIAFDGLVEGVLLVLDTLAAGLVFLGSIASGVLACLAARWVVRKTIIRGNMLSGTKVGL